MNLILYILFSLIVCSGGTTYHELVNCDSSEVNEETDHLASKCRDSKNDSNTLDSLTLGSTFYRNDAFINYTFLEAEPYEFISFNSEKKSTQLMVFLKEKTKYLVLITASGLVDKVDYNWEKLEKEVNYIISFPEELDICWYVTEIDEADKTISSDGIGIGQFIEESENGTLFRKEKLLMVDYKNGSVQEVVTDSETFLCTDGH